MNFRNLLSRFNILDNPRTIYLNDDGSILTWSDRLRKEKQLTREQAIGNFYSCLYADKDANTEFFNQLLAHAGLKGCVEQTISVKNQKTPLQVRIEAVKSDEGVVLGFTMTER